jgi:hypothetical protein
MFSRVVQAVAGEATDAAAWDAIFRHFNQTCGRGTRGYQRGEKIAVKINLTACNARGAQVDPITYEKKAPVMNTIDNSPQMLLALLRHLVYTVGVRQGDISVGDPTGLFRGSCGICTPRIPRCATSTTSAVQVGCGPNSRRKPFHWSAGGPQQAAGLRAGPVRGGDVSHQLCRAQGTFVRDYLCAKNLYGALLRCPDGFLRDEGMADGYYDMYLSLPNAGWSPGLGRYRALVDLMGHANSGQDAALSRGRPLRRLLLGLASGALSCRRLGMATGRTGRRACLPRRTRWRLTRSAMTS